MSGQAAFNTPRPRVMMAAVKDKPGSRAFRGGSGFARSLGWIAVWAVLLACSSTPRLYTMKPSALEDIRSQLSTVGVHITPEQAKSEALLPAKGAWGGLKRGIVVGAALPVMIGLVSPVPGGTVLGILVAPVGALIGGAHGAAAALPAEEVERAERQLTLATETARQKDYHGELADRLIAHGNSSTNLKFVAWPDTQRILEETSRQRLRPTPRPDPIDARLDIRAERSGLRGRYHIDPVTEVFLQIRVRLIRTRDEKLLLDERFTCTSENERQFKDWASQEGIYLVEEFESCLPELAEKIVDDCFRVYPLSWNAK